MGTNPVVNISRNAPSPNPNPEPVNTSLNRNSQPDCNPTPKEPRAQGDDVAEFRGTGTLVARLRGALEASWEQLT